MNSRALGTYISIILRIYKNGTPNKILFRFKNYYELENVLNGKDKNRLQCLFLLGLRNQFEKNNRKKG